MIHAFMMKNFVQEGVSSPSHLLTLVSAVPMINVEEETKHGDEPRQDHEAVINECVVLWQEEVNPPNIDDKPDRYNGQPFRRAEPHLGVYRPLFQCSPSIGLVVLLLHMVSSLLPKNSIAGSVQTHNCFKRRDPGKPRLSKYIGEFLKQF